jgi:predicted metalloprotease with PDZ domain
MIESPPSAIHYQVSIANLHAHLFKVTLQIAAPAAAQTLCLPVWIPGSYLVREFAKHLQNLQASQGGQAITLTQIDKASWVAQCNPALALQLDYEVYAFDTSVRTAWLDVQRGFFNGTSLFLRVVGQEQQPHTLELVSNAVPDDWQIATGLTARAVNPAGWGQYSAPDYDTLVDCPVEMGAFWSSEFTAAGVPHRFVVAGAPPSFDGARLLADTRAICEQQLQFWHGNGADVQTLAPFQDYLFLLNVLPDGYGGLEHRNSTALVCSHKDLPRLSPIATEPDSDTPLQSEGYTTLLGLISHEYFHAWNVKTLRPQPFLHYAYQQENYTQLLWFFEGFTSYYDDLFVLRAARIDRNQYLKLLNKSLQHVANTPGRWVQSVAQASMDAWVKYYRPDENTSNATVSYYSKGALVALCLDLTLRAEGKTTLDDVMRALYQRCHHTGMTENDLLAVLESLSGRSFSSEIRDWVHSTQELPTTSLLQVHGIASRPEKQPLAQQLGLRVKEQNGVTIQHVLRNSAAEQAGFASGDEWLAVQAANASPPTWWRLQQIDDILLYCANPAQILALISRQKRLQTLTLTLPSASSTSQLCILDASLVARWLG